MPLALHIPHVVEQVGSLAGFAAVIGLAVLSALYFSQARDLRRLREWAGRAPERAAEQAGAGTQQPSVPGRVVAVPQQQPQQTPQPATNGDNAPSVTAPASAPAKVAAGEQAANAEEGEGEASKPGESAGEQKPADEEQKPGEDGGAAPAKPGMPAPASAAAAGAASAAASAGAGTASVAGPAAPGAPPAKPASAPAKPAAAPQRPPGSVLPPRTGTLPPVRRLPSSNVGASQTGVLGQAPPQQRKKRNPVYIVLAIAGVLVLGAAAAIGVPALVNGSKNDNSSKTSSTAKKTGTAKTNTAAPAPTPGQITVAVLNGTSIPGLAAQIGDRVEADGFKKGTVSNASLTNGQRANSVVMYSHGHSRDARLVARKLGISSVQPVDSGSQGIAGDASVVVLVGTDKTQ